MIRLLRHLFHLIYRIVPKRNYAIIWGWPDYEDSVIAVEHALQSTAISKVVLLMTYPELLPPRDLGPKTIRVKKNSPSGLIAFLCAKYVIFTHPCFARTFPKNVIAVNVWHGMPIKNICWLLKGEEGISAQFTLATSPFWADIMERSMRPQGEVPSIGLPRNDLLFSDPSAVIKKMGLSGNQRLIAWLPTYRKSVRGISRDDGLERGNIFEMPDVEPKTLNQFLKNHSAVLIIKAHPMAPFDRSKSWSNLKIVDNEWLRERSLCLYEFLGATDFLISDISSVVIDYLLLDRPIIHAFSDLDEYKNTRGFSVFPVEDYFMGPVVSNASELYQAIEATLAGNDIDFNKRHHMHELSHQYCDNQSTQRLLETIGLK